MSPKRKNPQVSVVAVDLGAVRAIEIGEHDLVLVFLDLEMEATDALVGELDVIPLLAADGDRGGNVLVKPSTVSAVQDANGDDGHGTQERSGGFCRTGRQAGTGQA